MWKAKSVVSWRFEGLPVQSFELPGPENGGRIFLRNVGNRLSSGGYHSRLIIMNIIMRTRVVVTYFAEACYGILVKISFELELL